MSSKHKPKQRAERREIPKTARNWWIYLVLLLAILGAYSQVGDHEFINYDDPVYVSGNPHVRNGFSRAGVVWAFTSAHDANWFPLTWLSHMLDCQIFQLAPGPHHLTNVALHILNALLLFALLLRMTGSRWRSAFVAFAFALHPLRVESVAWVAERKDLLSALFWLLSLWAYLNFIERRSAGRYLLLVAMFACGLMSKPMVVTLPFALLLLDYWPLRRPWNGSLLVEKLPLFALSAASSVATYLVQSRGGAVQPIDQVPLLSRAGNALISYVAYLGKFAWPANLAVLYPYPAQIELWQALAAGTALAAITAAVLWAREARYLAVGWLWYLGTLVPVIGLVQVGAQARADRYTYVPVIGIAVMLAWGAAELLERRRWGRMAAASLGVTACLAMLVITRINVGYWQNSITLFTHAIEVTGDNPVAHNNLGVALKAGGRAPEAVAEFEAALKIRPQDTTTLDNLGDAQLAAGETGKAIATLQEALRLNPSLAKAHVHLGSAFFRAGRIQEAESQYWAALALDPESSEVQYGLGGVLLAQGRQVEAIPHLQQALPDLQESVAAAPADPDGHYNLGRLLGILGRTDEAIAQFSEAVRLRPDDAESHYNLGVALVAAQRYSEAAQQFATAIQIRPGYQKAEDALAALEKRPR